MVAREGIPSVVSYRRERVAGTDIAHRVASFATYADSFSLSGSHIQNYVVYGRIHGVKGVGLGRQDVSYPARRAVVVDL